MKIQWSKSTLSALFAEVSFGLIHIVRGNIPSRFKTLSMIDGSNQFCVANLSIPEHVQALSLPQACPLLNTGATALVSSTHSGK
jgi:hypothetical protein